MMAYSSCFRLGLFYCIVLNLIHSLIARLCRREKLFQSCAYFFVIISVSMCRNS
ncbi:unnamed protein product [Amoebophrya sp. A25]|nr:unnamed protein product [Amoebophrya sp. A25]|eukprot:GSA25T00014732001.1